MATLGGSGDGAYNGGALARRDATRGPDRRPKGKVSLWDVRSAHSSSRGDCQSLGDVR